MARNLKINTLLLTIMTGCAFTPFTANANDDINGFVALGAATIPDYEGSDDYDVMPLLMAKVNYKETYYAELVGTALRANISPYPAIEFGPVIGYSGGRDDDVDNNAVSRLREIDAGVEAGAFVKLPFKSVLTEYDSASLSAQFLSDISDTHEGTTIKLSAGYDRWINKQLSLGASISTTYASDDYNDAFFSIDADNASRSGLNQYDADGGFKDIGLRINSRYALSEKWGITGLIGYKKMIGDAADSPVVDDAGSDNQWMAGLGVSYRF